MRRCVAAVAVLASAASGCGKTATLSPPSAKAPLSLPASLRSCPASDATPRLVLAKSAGQVLVPGHPASALICRYWGRSGRIPEPEDERARIPDGEHGHAARSLADARRIVRQDVTTYLASELDALPPYPQHANCDEQLGGRSDLIIFHYQGGSEVRVVTLTTGCIPVSNGRIVRSAIGAGHGSGEPAHWFDEELL